MHLYLDDVHASLIVHELQQRFDRVQQSRVPARLEDEAVLADKHAALTENEPISSFPVPPLTFVKIIHFDLQLDCRKSHDW